MKVLKFNKKIFLAAFLIMITLAGFTQNGLYTAIISHNILWIFLILALILVFGVALVLHRIILDLIRILSKQIFQELGMDLDAELKKIKPQETAWQEAVQALTDVVPIEHEKEILFEHEYDGIRELDNKLPPWWVGMFYASIVFAVVYLGYYHVFGGPSSIEEYEKEMAVAAVEKEAITRKIGDMVNEENVTVLTDKFSISTGNKIFVTNCMPCHGEFGEGKEGLGPNLTDQYWIHGGSINNVFSTITNGVTGKSMQSWRELLTPKQIQEVSSFILSLQGTNPPNAKQPEGTLYTPEQDKTKNTGDSLTTNDIDSISASSADEKINNE